MDALQIATAVIEAGAGLALLGLPARAATLLLGAPLESPEALTVARVGGAGLLTVAAAFWLARGDTQSHAARGLIEAVVIYNVAVVLILGIAGLRAERVGVLLWPAVVLHIAMTVWCVVSLQYSNVGERSPNSSP